HGPADGERVFGAGRVEEGPGRSPLAPGVDQLAGAGDPDGGWCAATVAGAADDVPDGPGADGRGRGGVHRRQDPGRGTDRGSTRGNRGEPKAAAQARTTTRGRPGVV